MDRQRLLERFLRYVKIDTTAQDGTDKYPSSSGQLELGRLLVEEFRTLGVADARQDGNGIVMATIPPSIDGLVPVVAMCAHLDTSPETPGADIKPQVVEDYPGGDLVLPGGPDLVIRTAENPELDAVRGHTIITSDGTTLLGADDKAGVAEIMETAAWLVEHPEIRHGPLRICFTCDEEIGHGVDKLDLDEIAAVAGYTLDGHGAGKIDVETFSADLAVVTIRGVNIHPAIAKGRMTNALKVAADFLGRLPRDRLSPESTEDRDGFVHPYEISGGVAEVKVRTLLRDFQTAKLAERAQLLRDTAAATMAAFPQAKIDVAVTPQYRNMAEGLGQEPRAVAYAEEALRRLGRTAQRTFVRGGTDGSRLTELGLPTPNLSTGEYNPHSPLEWASLDEMLQAVEWLVSLAEVWAEDKANDK
jgi:tripeptide aminopeptidase